MTKNKGHKLTSKDNDRSTLHHEDHLVSRNNKFKLVMQHDGNLVCYDGNEQPFWASNTCGKGQGPFRCVMQTDGNLVVYDKNNHPTWASNTNGKGSGPYKLVLQEDRNLVVYDKAKTPTWASNTHGNYNHLPQLNFTGHRLHSHRFHSLVDQQFIQSESKEYKAVMQADGNFVLYDNHNKPHWASNTNGKGQGPYRVTMQEDGNLVVYDRNNHPTWASNTNGKGQKPFRLEMQNDRNLVVYDKNNHPT